MSRRPKQPLVAAVKRELAELDRRRPGAKRSWEAELALELAAEVDAREVLPSPLRDRVAAGKALVEVMAELRKSVPAEESVDRLDELAKRRQARRAS